MLIEAEVAEGLEDTARDEIQQHLGGEIDPRTLCLVKGAVQFSYSGSLTRLAHLRSVNSIYCVLQFAVPRPRALLGHQHLTTLFRALDHVLESAHPGSFASLHLSAAGSDTSIMNRIKDELIRHTGLKLDDVAGDLLIRIRPASTGWEVLVRTTPRPLATRGWRACNFEGALNAPTAYALIRLLNVGPDDVLMNIGCGSATLLIEAFNSSPARLSLGCDISQDALQCARLNIRAANLEAIILLEADMRALPLQRSSVTALCADLPFGQLVGTHEENQRLYPAMLREAARIAATGARFGLITHEIRLVESLLRDNAHWRVEQVLRVSLRGLHPRIYLLSRR